MKGFGLSFSKNAQENSIRFVVGGTACGYNGQEAQRAFGLAELAPSGYFILQSDGCFPAKSPRLASGWQGSVRWVFYLLKSFIKAE